ncbi:MAG: helix-turn-helix domain-containing protein [Bacteroidota bacterium]
MIFGFKVRYLRLQNQLSYQELAARTGMSTSYLNDIEKGKKYPKPDKITILGQALGVDYDEMVSTKANKKLQPIVDLLNSRFFKLFPLDEFGISPEKLLELFTNTPDRVNAFVSTIFRLGRRYHIGEHDFYREALRSYQDMYDNYFPFIEEEALAFRKKHALPADFVFGTDFLEEKLKVDYGISVERRSLPGKKANEHIRSYYVARKKVLLIHPGLTTKQETFLLAREIGFQALGLTDRPFVTRIPKMITFEKQLNNFRASYFAVALLMEENRVVADVKHLAGQASWKPELLLDLLHKYQVSPEMLIQRLTNILPKHFGFKELFFRRISGRKDLKDYRITKELHLSRVHKSLNNALDEHYCRRWVGIHSLRNLNIQMATQGEGNDEPMLDAAAQISSYYQSDGEYLCMSIAKPSTYNPQESVSVVLGILITPQLRETFYFLNDPQLLRKQVNSTCERCPIPDCGARVAPPKVIEKNMMIERLNQALIELEKEV